MLASRHETSFSHSRLSLPTGVELDAIQSGDPAGVPLLLLHGISDSAPSMKPMMAELPSGIRAIAVTQRGHGDSSKPAGPYTTAAFVDDAAAALDALGVERAVIFGHSMGSIIAQRFAIDHPGRTAALILEGAFPTLSNNPAVVEFYEAEIAPMQGAMDASTARAFQESTLARPVPQAFLDLVSSEARKLPAHAWKAILKGMMNEDSTPELRRLNVPTLILWGDQDAFTGKAQQDALLNAIEGSTLLTFEGTGHDPHWEEPARAARLVGEFALRHAAPSFQGAVQ